MQSDEDEAKAASTKTKKSKSQKKAAFNPFDDFEAGAAAGDEGGTQDDYNPFADFMDGVSEA